MKDMNAILRLNKCQEANYCLDFVSATYEKKFQNPPFGIGLKTPMNILIQIAFLDSLIIGGADRIKMKN